MSKIFDSLKKVVKKQNEIEESSKRKIENVRKIMEESSKAGRQVKK